MSSLAEIESAIEKLPAPDVDKLAGWLETWRMRQAYTLTAHNGQERAPATAAEALPPREALRRLQEEARLKPEAAEKYLQEIRAERLAVEDRFAVGASRKLFES